MKRFLIVYFPIYDAGGITTWTDNLAMGLRSLGHEVDVSYASMSGNLKTDSDKYLVMSKRDSRLPSTPLGYGTSEKLAAYAERTKDYDAVVFAHPAPHDTKAYNDPDMMWLGLYEESLAPCISVFHDDGWKRNNDWARNIVDVCEGILFAQHRFYEYAFSNTGGEPLSITDDNLVTWCNFPIAWRDEVGLYDIRKVSSPRRICTSIAQWQPWKNHKYLLPQLKGVTTFQMKLYGFGIQYCYLRKEQLWRDVVSHDYTTGFSSDNGLPHEFMGYVKYALIPDALMEASCSVDASVKGRENMGMIEPMAYGDVSMISSEALLSSPWQKLTESCVVAAPLDNLVSAIEDVCLFYDYYQSERESGVEYVLENHCKEDVAKRIVLMLEAICDGETGRKEEGLKAWLSR